MAKGQPEQAGFEPAVPFGTTVFKTVAKKTQLSKQQTLTTPQNHCVQTSVQTKPQNDQNQTQKLPADLAEIVQLWPSLPEHIKAAIKALAGLTEKPEGR